MYVASCSFGKDSIAQVILAHKHNEPLDLIVYSEVMFDEKISGEIPEHRDFIYNKAIPRFESWGYTVKVLRSNETYMKCFNKVVRKSKVQERIGKKYGFPMAGKCLINDRCKVGAIRSFFKDVDMSKTIQYIGIALDEPKRLDKLKGTNKISLLAKYEYTEEKAMELCREYDLLSPIYEFTPRGGCWFCPNARKGELRHLYDNHREFLNLLLDLEMEENLVGNMWNTLAGIKITDIYKNFMWENRQMTIFDFLK